MASSYEVIQQEIIDALVGRPAGTQIQPENHQKFALDLLDYIRSVEIIGASALQGNADPNTIPVQPDNAKVSYISSVPPGQTYVYSNFLDENGNPISVTSGSNTLSLLTLLWNGRYWTVSSSVLSLAVGYTNGYLFKGIALPATNPGTPDQNVFYIGEAGTYPNFGGATIPDGYIGLLEYNGGWTLSPVRVTPPLANDFNGGTDRISSAELSKTLKGFVDTNAENIAKLDFKKTNLVGNTVDLSSFSKSNYTIREDGTYGTSASYKHIRIPVNGEQSVEVTAGSNFTRIAFLASNSASTSGGTIDVVPGTSVIQISAGVSQGFVIPAGTVLIAIYVGQNEASMPSSVILYGLVIDDLKSSSVKNALSANMGLELGARSKVITMFGADDTLVQSNRIPILKDHIYELYLSNPEINKSNITYTTSTYYILKISNFTEQLGGEVQDEFVTIGANKKADPFQEKYVFTPTENGWLIISMRANSGERQIFDLIDKTGVVDSDSILDNSGVNYTADSVKKITNTEVISAELLPQLLSTLDVDEIQIFDSAYLGRFKADFSVTKDTQKYGMSASYKHCILDVSYADYIYCKSDNGGISLAFTDAFGFGSSGGNITGLIDSVIYLGNGEFVVKKPAGALVCLFYCSGSDYSSAEVRVFNKLPKNASEVKKILCAGPQFWHHGAAVRGALMRYFPQYSYRIETGERSGSSRSCGGVYYSFPVRDTSWTNEVYNATGQHGMCASLNRGNVPDPNPESLIPSNSPWYIVLGITAASYDPIESDFTIVEMEQTATEKINDVAKQSALRNVEWQEVQLSRSDSKTGYVYSELGTIMASSYHYEVPIPAGASVLCIISDERSSQTFYFFEEVPDFSVDGSYGKYVANPINYLNGRSAGNDPLTQPLYEIPEGAHYVCINCSSSRYVPQRVAFGFKKNLLAVTSEEDSTNFITTKNDFRARAIQEAALVGLTPLNPALDSDNYELPRFLQEKNTILKCQQLSRLKWTPKSDFYGKTLTNTHLYVQGVEQTGIPYSNNFNDYKYIGQTVSIHTFMTAINNLYSLIYTERVSTSGSQSIWGRTYYGPNGNAYYGSVCCAFTSYVDGYDGYIGNKPYKNFSTNFGVTRAVSKQGEYDINLLRIGDVLNNDSHSIVVIGLRRNGNGEIDQIRISECTGSYARGGARIRTVSPEGFASLLWSYSSDPYTIYRYNDFYRNTKYTPSEYVAAGDETTDPTQVSYNNDICTIYGDRATIAEGYQMVLNYDLDGQHGGWTGIEVYKDEVLINTYNLNDIDQNALPEGQRNHALDLGNQLTQGLYKARMINGNNYSDYVYWEVISNSVSVEKIDEGVYKVTNNTGKDLVECVLGTYKQDEKLGMGRISLIQPLTQEDINNDFFTLYLRDLLIIGEANLQTPMVFKLVIRGAYNCCATAVIKFPDVQYNEGGGDDDPEGD